MTAPCDLSAVAARAAIGSRQLSPVELLESCIERIEAVNPAINAMVGCDFDTARVAARAAEAAVMRGDVLGALHGLPLGVKDLIDAKGLPTTYGSPLFAQNIAARDEAVVARLRSAGAVIVGKTNTPEWGAGGNTRNIVYGATGNPFNPAYSAAGSSGGSGAALATGMVSLATGSDTGGSCRNPAAFCGIVGLRPTPGLIGSDSRAMAWMQLPQLGPMARDVADTALMLSVMAGPEMRDPLCHHSDPGFSAALPRVDLATLKVAFTPDFGFAPTEAVIRQTFADRIGRIGPAFASCTEAHPDCTDADRVFAVLRAVMFLGRHRELAEKHPDMVGPNIADNIAEGRSYSAVDVATALNQQTALYRNWQTFFAKHDIVLAPTTTISPRPWRELYPAAIDGVPTKSYFHWLALAYAVTNVGHPAVSVPLGRDGNGMPFGLQVIGPRGGDALTLAVAAEIERLGAADPMLARPLPDIGKLEAAPPISGMDGFRDFA